ncbi:MAG: OmpA family protein [Bacteroidota bacterium]
MARFYSLLLALLITLALSQSLQAQQNANGISIKKVFVDYHTPFEDGVAQFSELEHALELGYFRRLGKRFNLSIPIKVGAVRLPQEGGGFDSRKMTFMGDAVLQLNILSMQKKISPYLLGGGGYVYTLEDDSNVQFPVGAGFHFKIGANAYANVEAQRRFSLEDDRDNFHYSVGLVLLIGDPEEDEPKELPPVDTDGDGISDNQDECPDKAGLAAFGGCPDTDKDGISDKNDDCPTEAGIAQFNGCPDTDKDGLADKDDDCPTEAGPATNNGCPLQDADGDGIVDAEDECPNDAGIAALNGCPDTDSDGVADKDDRCPDVAGSTAMNGCPDTDSDGVADPDDKCPNRAGPASNSGCPEIEEKDKEVLTFAMQAVQFETSRATLKSSSFDILDQVAGILKKYPNYSLSINGHTDSIGGTDTNQLLSERRAKSCYDYLKTKGINPSRMDYKGFGESQPIADNRYREGRSKNRRVEFNIYLK